MIEIPEDMRKEVVDRFWSYVDKTNSCWNWTGALRNGYGAFKYMGKLESAHRVVYRLTIGEILEGLLICHHCDNPKCVNPNHLFMGTYSDNMKDAYDKGRVSLPKNNNPFPKGEDHPDAKITNAQAREIKQRLSNGERHIDIAEDYPISRWMISKIATGRRWIDTGL